MKSQGGSDAVFKLDEWVNGALWFLDGFKWIGCHPDFEWAEAELQLLLVVAEELPVFGPFGVPDHARKGEWQITNDE